jgi:small basic protein (TIGR04137 family)
MIASFVVHTGRVRTMSIDKSLKKAGGLARARNVLTRAERLALLQEDERWTPEKGVYNLPKTKFRRLAPGQSGPKRPASQG